VPAFQDEGTADDPAKAVLARAKAAIAAGDRVGALALLHVLLTEGAEVAATLTPVLAEALIATARAQADEQDRHERDLAAGGIGHCPWCGRFRRILATRDGRLRACRGCAQSRARGPRPPAPG
jgi:hypothetical protein